MDNTLATEQVEQADSASFATTEVGGTPPPAVHRSFASKPRAFKMQPVKVYAPACPHAPQAPDDAKAKTSKCVTPFVVFGKKTAPAKPISTAPPVAAKPACALPINTAARELVHASDATPLALDGSM